MTLIGAGGILGYVTTLLEQIVVVHFIRLILAQQPALLREILFIKDGPLAFFGQTANMYKKMRALVRYLLEHHNLYMAGLEKSGAFVDHAAEIATVLKDGSVLLFWITTTSTRTSFPARLIHRIPMVGRLTTVQS